jgi:branched-chain amino acid transport system ATP-binding protein
MEFGGLIAVNDVDLHVQTGAIHGLIGPNGSGKTTLLNMMSGWLRPTSGSLRWRGEDVSRRRHYRLARAGIGRTFQTGTLFDEMSCLDNVSMSLYASTGWNPLAGIFGLRSERSKQAAIRAKGIDLLAQMDIADVAQEPAGSLPLGYRRWLGIATALSSDPDLLMLDEPLAGMNRIEKEATMQRITSLPAAGVTILLVEHDMNAVMEYCDVVSVLEAGRKIAEGTPQEIRSNPRVIDAYLGVQD